MMSSSDEKHREAEIHTDSDWKEQVRREKERLAQELSSEPSHTEIPPASISALIEELSVRALICLGQLADPRTGQGFVDFQAARYAIELLEAIQTKTRGNLDSEEASYLGDVLHNLRLAYVEVARSVGEQIEESRAGGQAGSTIVTPDDVASSGSSSAGAGERGDAPDAPDEPDEPDEPERPGPRIIL